MQTFRWTGSSPTCYNGLRRHLLIVRVHQNWTKERLQILQCKLWHFYWFTLNRSSPLLGIASKWWHSRVRVDKALVSIYEPSLLQQQPSVTGATLWLLEATSLWLINNRTWCLWSWHCSKNMQNLSKYFLFFSFNMVVPKYTYLESGSVWWGGENIHQEETKEYSTRVFKKKCKAALQGIV